MENNDCGKSMIFIRMCPAKHILGLSLQANVWNISSYLWLRYGRLIPVHVIHFYYGDNNKMYIVILDEADSGKEFAGITQYNLVVEQKLWEIVHQTLYV